MRTKLLVAAVLGAVVLTLVTALVLRDPRLERPSEPDGPTGAGGSRSSLLTEVYARFDPKHPGRGVTDYPGASDQDIPKSYAMIVLADLERRRHGIRTDLPDLVQPAGRWLLDHATEAENGTVGWGLPVAWDAYGDGSENPAGTVYAISTGITADALLTWMEADPEAPGEEILETIGTALDNFARAPATPDGLIPYSLEPADQPYDTFNPAAYVAGQMQRFAKYATNPELARRLTDSADATVNSLVRNHLKSPDGHWYWRYSVQEKLLNDMPHASYIIDGLRTYVREGGALADEVDLPRVVGHLEEFADAEGRPRAWPAMQEDIDNPPRLYDLGMALSLACTEPAIASVANRLLPTVASYRASDGSGFLKFPAGTPDQEPLVVNEYEAYLWRGLVACATDELAGGDRDEPSAGNLDSRRTSVPAAVRDTVPFVQVGRGASGVTFADGTSGVDLAWSSSRVEQDGLVLRAVDDGAGGALLVRGFPRNDLRLVTLDGAGQRLDDLDLRISDDSAPILRDIALHRGVLHVVLYDNPTLGNYLLRLERRPAGYAPVGKPLLLPSVEDQSGRTYEMVPPFFLLPSGDAVHLVAGTLSATIDGSGTLTEGRLSNCLRAIEAAATPDGPVVLCQQLEEVGPGAPFELLGPDGIDLPRLVGEDGVPFGLRVVDGEVQLSFATTPAALARMLRFDLRRTDAGWLEYGTDNVEGRLAWSQVYYLNGFLDFLLLAGDGGARWDGLSNELKGMRTRLDQEVAIADRQWRDGGYETRAFTVDRSLALFAVQTSRLLLLEERYAREVTDPAPLPGRDRLRAAVSALAGHIDVRRDEGQEPWWWPPGTPYLAWPKGSGFTFDGLNVPYNHQNEWAYAVTRAGRGVARTDAEAIVAHFLRRVAPGGTLPLTGTWNYWWGQAWDGWTKGDGVSANTPAYDGDHIPAGKSFRSIDVMSALATAPSLDAATRAHLYSSAATLVTQDHLYPFVGYELRRAGLDVRLPDEVVRRYLRISSPWEVQSAAWAYDSELDRLAR